MATKRSTFFLLVGGLALGGGLVATDSVLTGNLLTWINANQLAEQVDWDLITENVSIEIHRFSLPADHQAPETLPILEWAPYRAFFGGPDLHYEQSVVSGVEGIAAGWMRVRGPCSVEAELRASAQGPLIDWLAVELPSLDLFNAHIRMSREMRVAGPSPGRLRVLFQISDKAGDAEVIVAVTHDLDTARTDAFEIVVGPGDPANLEAPSW